MRCEAQSISEGESGSISRRAFLAHLPVAGLVPRFGKPRAAFPLAASEQPAPGPDDELYWAGVQSRFALDRTAIYLNAAGIAPTTQAVIDAMAADAEFSNRLPARHVWSVLEPRVESVRSQLAEALGSDPEELALTRNATEALQIAQLGIELDRGDHVLTTDQDFFRMLNTFEQRVARDGIVLDKISIPTPAEDAHELVAVFERAMTPRTRLLLVSHVTNVSGQVLPVGEICALARERGIRTIVDGAQAFGHIPVDLAAIDCDYYGGSLHKYALGPLGTGFLRLRRDRIERTWPLTPAAHARVSDVRKFEDVGTHSAAPHNALSEALRFRASLGQARIGARIRLLNARWIERARRLPGAIVYTRPGPHTGAITTVGHRDVEPRQIVGQLWDRFRIVTRPVVHPDCNGVRVSPHVYNTLDEIDRFGDALETLFHEWRTS